MFDVHASRAPVPTRRRVRPPFLVAVGRGFSGRCPNCGKSKLFRGYLKQVDACPVCGERWGHIRADDAPPWLTILIVGHIIIPAAMAVVDDEAVSTTGFGEDDRRIDDADSLDRGDHQGVGLGRRFRLASLVGIVLEQTGIDDSNTHGMFLSGVRTRPSCRSFSCLLFSEDTSRTAGRPDRRNCGRASLRRRTSGADGPAKDELPGCAGGG